MDYANEPPTPAQFKVLVALWEYTNRNGHPPTYAELGTMLEVGATVVESHVVKLRLRGLVTMTARTKRTLALTVEGRERVRRSA